MIVFLILCYIFNFAYCASPLIEVEHGRISGTFYTLLPDHRRVHTFYGIPYAAAPVHEYRFKPPQALVPWLGVRNASIKPSKCLQYNYVVNSIIGEEDCLYLNVYTPKLPQNNTNPLMDVLVYIHGGAFTFGDGESGRPDYIMKNHDIVYVSVNYRLGVLGFFSSGDTAVPGNIGLKDQVAALKWIQRNIIKFGGNPASVTIFGSSTGAACVQYHYLSRMSEGIFHKGISVSGSVLPTWTLPRNNTQRSFRVASLVGCPVDSSNIMVECLKKRRAKQLIEAMKSLFGWQFSPYTIFGPVIEPMHPDAFLSQEPVKLLQSENVKNLPWLLILSKDEGIFPSIFFITNETLLQELDENWNDLTPDLLMFNYTVSSQHEKNKISLAIRKFYFGDEPISKKLIKEIIRMNGDRKYVSAAIRAAKLHASVVSKDKVFCLKFSYRGKYSVSDKFDKERRNFGVCHGDAANYVITNIPNRSDETAPDIEVGNWMSSTFTSFMKTGNPITNGVEWEPVSSNQNDNLRCLEINSANVQYMTEYSNKAVIKFWENLLPSEYSQYLTISLRSDEL